MTKVRVWGYLCKKYQNKLQSTLEVCKVQEKTECIATLQRPDGRTALTESRQSNVLLETVKGILIESDETSLKLGTPETSQIVEVLEPFATGGQVVTEFSALNNL